MIIPIRCFTCNANVPYVEFVKKTTVEQKSNAVAMNELKLKRYCCRRMIMCNPSELTDIISDYDTHDQHSEDGSKLLLKMQNVRTVNCE